MFSFINIFQRQIEQEIGYLYNNMDPSFLEEMIDLPEEENLKKTQASKLLQIIDKEESCFILLDILIDKKLLVENNCKKYFKRKSNAFNGAVYAFLNSKTKCMIPLRQ